MDDEILEPETSNEELIDEMFGVYEEEVQTDGGTHQAVSCAGNISHACVRESLNQVSDALEGREDYVLVGGIPTQMEVLRRKGDDSPLLMEYFGRRYTNDLDILTTDPSGVRRDILQSGYDESELLDIDPIGTGLIDGTDDIIDNGELRSYSAYETASTPLEAELRVPSDTDLLYTKVHDQESRESEGTSTDAEIIAESGIFEIDPVELHQHVNGNSEAQDYLEQELAY
ncbi:MAG: hypothetical protein ABEJ36_01385 [Candidatus Nanosalina sp.]